MQKDIPIGNIFIESKRLERTYRTRAEGLTKTKRLFLKTIFFIITSSTGLDILIRFTSFKNWPKGYTFWYGLYLKWA